MNKIQLTDHLTARISAEGTCGRYRAKICEKYAKRERKAIAYVATLNEES